MQQIYTENNNRHKNVSVFGLWVLWTTPEFGVPPTLSIIPVFLNLVTPFKNINKKSAYLNKLLHKYQQHHRKYNYGRPYRKHMGFYSQKIHPYHSRTNQITNNNNNIYNLSSSVFGLWILWATPEFGVSPTLCIISCFS